MEIRPLEDDALTRLYEASIEGSLITFNSLITKDPLILSRISLSTFNETPLHISALLGHLDFTRQLLIHKPKLASELDFHKRSPLHLASAEGHTEVVQALLQENGDQNMCLAKDQDGKIPLHYAALRGRIDVIKLLISARKESVLEVVPDGQTVLHLCVKYNHLEALKVLVELEGAYENCELLNSKEHANGNTILHLAVMLKQVETVEYLLSVPKIKDGADEMVNHRGLKAFELLEYISGTDFISDKIRQTINDSGLATSTSSAITQKSSTEKSSKRKSRNWFGFLKYKGDWMEDKRGSIMIVSTVISTMTYQTAINPPGGVWQETRDRDNYYDCSKDNCIAGTSILARDLGDRYTVFMIYNSISFLASLCIILLLISGVRLRNKLFMFLLTLVMCAAVTALAFTFLIGIVMVTPRKRKGLLYGIFKASSFAWIILLCFIFLFHVIRFLYWIVKKLRRLRNKLFMFLLTLFTCAAVTDLAVIILVDMVMVNPEKIQGLLYKIFEASIFAWIILLGVIFLFHVIRFLYWIVKKLWRLFKPKSSRTN